MSIPTNQIAQYLKAIPYNPGIISNDPQLAYLLSFQQHPISNDSVHFHPRQTYESPLSQYQFAEFDDNTFDQLYDQTIKNYKAKNISVVKGIRSSFKQFFARVSAITYQSALKFNHLNVVRTEKIFQTSKIELDYRVETMKGNIPAKWPEGVNQFQKELESYPWNAFSSESELLIQEFVTQIKTTILNQLKKSKNIQQIEREALLSKICQYLQIIISIALRTLSLTFIIEQVHFITSSIQQVFEFTQKQEQFICSQLVNYLKTFILKIPKEQSNTQNTSYHCLQNVWDKNAFLIMKKAHFQKVAGLAYYTATTDGQYLYLYISAINGAMYKIGTGNRGTVAGKVYFEKQINLPVGSKLEQVNWVYLKGKLYLKTFTRQPSFLEIIDPENFKKTSSVQLSCQSLFGHHALNTLNKNSIILTDGQSLYFLGKRIKITQHNQIPQNAVKTQEKKQQPQNVDAKNRKQLKKKNKQKNKQAQQQQPQVNPPNQQQQPTRLLQFILVQFDVEGKFPYLNNDESFIDQEAITQLFESFSGYFTRQQCIKAWRINHYDVMQACQWLFDQGSKQKQKNIKILPAINLTILCQAQIISNFNEKVFKNPNQIITKQGSLLHMHNINESIWTMDRQQITCYSQTGAKIFRKKSTANQQKGRNVDSKQLILHKDTTKYLRNPQYYFIHDPYNGLFYTFYWFNDGHYFPCPILVSKDKKQEQQFFIKKRSAVDTTSPTKLAEIGRFFITQLCLLQNIVPKKDYRFNDQIWWYGQRINQVTLQAAKANLSYDDKKKLTNKKSKLLTKINKINEVTKRYQKDSSQFNRNKKIIRQIIKIYPYQSDGSLGHLELILKFFNEIENCSNNQIIGSFLMTIDKWLSNLTYLLNDQHRKNLLKVHEILKKIRNGPSTSESNKHEINKVIIKYFNLFYSQPSDATSFIIELPLDQIDYFLKSFEGGMILNRKEFIAYELTKKDQIISKYQSKYDFNDLFKTKSNNSLIPENNIFADMFIRRPGQTAQKAELHQKFLTFLEKCLIEGQNQSTLTIRFFITLFSETFKRLNINDNTNKFLNKQTASSENIILLENLFEDSFKILQKCLSSNISVFKTVQLTECISHITQIYYSSIVRIFGNEIIIKSLVKIIELLQKPELVEFFSYIKNHQFQGVSAIQQKIYQTSHPLERGKSQSFPHFTSSEASLLFLEFDKRCQSDQNHDIMTVQLLHEDLPIGNSIPCNDGVFTTNLRLTGKIQMKKPTLMLGNSLSVDFTSSGHAKDAQSFGRFGFKFGLRPVIAGKISYEKNADIAKIQKVFKSKSNFNNYINTLKFLVVAASGSIQNLFNIQSDSSSDTIKQLLKGKIIRQGLQESKKLENKRNNQIKVNNFLEKQYEDAEKNILKKLNISLLKKLEKKADEKIQLKQQKNDLWSLQGIPTYIRGYIEQIKNFKGNFIEVFKQARQHAPPQGSYSHQLRRPGFTGEFKQLWLQGEALLFLTVLKHSGLLHLNLKFSIQYIKENLKAFEQARNGIFYAFITRMQNVRQWRDLIQTYHGKTQEQQKQQVQVEQKPQKKQKDSKQISIRKNNRVIRTVHIGNAKTVPTRPLTSVKKPIAKVETKSKQALQEERLKEIEKIIRERLNNQFLIQQLCSLKKIPFIPNNIYENVTNILTELKKQTSESAKNTQSVYIEPIQHLIEGCLFLLSFKSPSTKETLEEDNEIVPMSLGRSLSSDHKITNHNKVQIFREWLENWKKWKGFKKENKVELKFPVLEIVQFINTWINLKQIKESIHRRSLICEHRISFYKYLIQLLKATNSCSILFNKYAFGSELLNLDDNYKSNLESSSLTKLENLSNCHREYINILKELESKFIREELPLSYKKFMNDLKSNTGKNDQINYKTFLSKLKINAEILYLLESQNLQMNLDVALFFINFKYLSNQNEEILFLSNLITQRAFIVDHKIEDILKAIKKEVGDNSLAAKRWKDLLFIERLSFLLRKLEVIVRKKNLQIDQKQKVAETLFYTLNLTDIPFINRAGLRIIKRLKDVNLAQISTIFNHRYKSIKIDESFAIQINEHFSVENKQSLNNLQLMSKKTLSIFKQGFNNFNQVQKKLLDLQAEQSTITEQQVKQQSQDPKSTNPTSPKLSNLGYNIVLNLHHQQDMIWFLRVLYYIEQLERQSGKGNIRYLKDWKQYLQTKVKTKKEQQNVVQPAQQKAAKSLSKQQMFRERILGNIPQKIRQIDPKLEEQLPIGWFMNYCNIFKEFTTGKPYTKSSKQLKSNKKQNTSKISAYNPNNNVNPPANKKAWQSPIFLKLSKKFQEFQSAKPLEQPKQTDAQNIKEQFVKAKNFITRIRKHLYEISTIMQQFSNYGFYIFKEDISKEKAIEICQLISLGVENRLNPLSFISEKQQYKTRLTIQDNPTSSSKLKITLMENQNYQIFQELTSIQSLIPITTQNITQTYTQISKRQYILQDSIYNPFEQFLHVQQASGKQQIQFSKQFIDSKIFKMKKKHQEVYLPDYPDLKYFIAQGGVETGLKNITLIPAAEHALTLQSVELDTVLTHSVGVSAQYNTSDQEFSQFPEQIIEKLINLIGNKLSSQKSITTRDQMMNYLLVSFYLKKLSKMDLGFINKELLKKLANSLVNMNLDVKSFQPIQHYETEIQKLLIKLIDYNQENLKIFEIFNHNDYQLSPSILNYINKKEANGPAQQTKPHQGQESSALHHFPRSSYLLKSQPPQIQQNKLLKYWEKNILPKIYEFVKTTLRPIEIQDFFEQMRIPLRKNDQMEAKKIAYVICDNKLPQGAVLPDSNHNWNSFNLQDVTVGQYALVKLPRNKLESISPLLSTGNQQYRLVKIIFIDTKNSAILVRYRIDEYSLMSYLWVPINSLVRVEKQIMHLAPSNLYTQIDKNLKGMIYGYSKLCLTQLTAVSSLDELKLIKQTIADMFVQNPISGWLNSENKTTQWSMRANLKRMMNENQTQIIDYLEKQFCPIESYETDLFTDETVKLNRFQNITSLIVSFKKTAAISLSSGLKFYKDPYLFNQMLHIYTTKSEKTQFQPIIFTDPNAFVKYYTNKECLKIAEQNKYLPKPINITVFGIKEIWTIGCYLGQIISEIAEQQLNKDKQNSLKHLEILKRLNKLYIKWILKKKVAVLCGTLAKLVSKITNRIIAIQDKLHIKTTYESLGIQQNEIKELLNWIKTLLQEEESTTLALYSQILQNLSEMMAIFLRKTFVPGKNIELTEHIDAMINLINVLRQIDEHLKGKKNSQKFQSSGQWQRFLKISNVPNFVDRKQLVQRMKEIIRQNKGKVLCPKYDFFTKDDKLIICVEGWNITQLVEQEIAEKIEKQEQEQKEQQNEDQGLMMQWSCEVCTFVNPMGNSHCQMCGTEMPPPPVAKQIYEQVQATDVSKAENKLRELQSKRFDTIKQQIHNFFKTYWQSYCKKTQKRNKQLQQQAKNKGNVLVKKKKNGNEMEEAKEEEKVKPIPEKPEISLTTGSEILNDEIIEDFLALRLAGFKQTVRDLVQNQTTYLAKFKKLEGLGYDLWCDHIFHENPSLIPFERLYQLMNYIQGEICKGSSSVLSYSENSIRLLSNIPLLETISSPSDQPLNYTAENDIGVKTKYKNLSELKSYNIRYSWKLVKELNVSASKCLQFINMNLKHYEGVNKAEPKESDCLAYKIRYFRNLIMGAIKLELNQKIIQKTSVLREPQEIPKIYLQRLRLREQRGKHQKIISIKEKEDFLFTKAHQQFAKVSPAMLRPFKPKGTDPYLSFSITFRGQNAMGEAGPYRQFFTDISNQLDPKNQLGLFIKTPNNKHNTGEAKSKWLINPKATSSYHLSLFEHIGILMGCCIRTGTHLALDLPKVFWKLLVSQPITDNDIDQIDHQFLETLKMVKQIPTEETFLQMQQIFEPITWTYTTSDEERHEIIHNGSQIKVTYEQRQKYISQVKLRRIHESSLQVNRIKKGLQQMMPQSYFNIITGDEMKLMVCGRPKVDVELLKKHTKYAGGLNEQQNRIKYFWQVMKQIQEADKLKVIKFCWGQERLPINSEQFQRNNIRFMIKPMIKSSNHDQSLPKADTCFFNIQLPNYSTKDILKKRLLLAVNLDCVSINADENFNPDDNPLMGEVEEQQYEDQEEVYE